MKSVRYDGEELIMLDEVADALLEFASAVVRSGGAEAISVPTLTSSGATQTVTLFLSAGVPLSTRLIDEPQDERHPSASFIEELAVRRAYLPEF
ncbi:hypothetical protein [Naasia lichenicola]|uniref:Uncharacterized protein n=1 Tax=Naasia lichenicola TaxID=2565933 RepID=A0A4S4FI13_9MICO|nr:hypothetical protein [Naasia lichenicola]THG29973.1 hypothetical protein E6C64_15125 [Naasia lichenicola]